MSVLESSWFGETCLDNNNQLRKDCGWSQARRRFHRLLHEVRISGPRRWVSRDQARVAHDEKLNRATTGASRPWEEGPGNKELHRRISSRDLVQMGGKSPTPD